MKAIVLWAVIVSSTLWWSGSARATDPLVPISGLHRTNWTAAQGAPPSVNAMIQTADGWIWVASGASLYRFDGMRFIPFVPANGTKHPGAITSFAEDRNGNLYLGYAVGGIGMVTGDRLDQLARYEDVRTVFALALDAQDTLWIAAANGLIRYAGGKFVHARHDLGYSGRRAEYVHADPYGRIWASSGAAWSRLDPDARRFEEMPELGESGMVVDSPDHKVWLVRGMELQLLANPRHLPRIPNRLIQRRSTYQSAFDKDGNFWRGNCPVGICKLTGPVFTGAGRANLDDSRVERLDQKWQLSGLQVNALFEDREGNIWIGTHKGLDRLRDQPVHMLSAIPEYRFSSGAVDRQGHYWVGGRTLSGMVHIWKVDGTDAMDQTNSDELYLVRASPDSLLLAGNNRVVRRSPQGDEHIDLPPRQGPARGPRSVQRLFGDAAGCIWLGLQAEGMNRHCNGEWKWLDYGRGGSPSVQTLDHRGRIWEGRRDNSLLIREGAQLKELKAEHGINVGMIRYIFAGAILLIAGESEFQIWHDGKFRTVLLHDTGTSAAVFGAVTTPDGTHWLNSSRGLIRATRAEWAAMLTHPGLRLKATIFDEAYGFPKGDEFASGSAAHLAPDGRIWVHANGSVGWIHPDRLNPNKTPPNAALLHMKAGEASYQFDQVKALAAGTKELAIHYTALSYRMPERVKFRYRLKGSDDRWQSVGARREAIYTNLGPGRYQFEVMAINESGVEGPVARSPEFTIEPTFTQSVWFKLLIAVGGAATLALLHRMRLMQLTRRIELRTKAQLEERERIARTLHDSFLQSVQGLLLKVQSALLRLPGEEPMRTVLEQALLTGEAALAEGRDQVKGLRSELAVDENLIEALHAAVPEAARAQVRIEGNVPELEHAVAAEIFGIVREALCNALRHSHGDLIRISFSCMDGAMQVTIQDNGVGLPAGELKSPPGHFGVQGMKERAAKIGAALAITNAQEGGALVSLRLRRRRSWRMWFAWKMFVDP